MRGVHGPEHRSGLVRAGVAVTIGVAVVGGATALAYARNPDQPGLPSERQDLLDGLTVAVLGWLLCLGLLAYASTRPAAHLPSPPIRPRPPLALLVAAVGLGLGGSVAELAGQTAATDRLSLVLWSDTFYVVGAVCVAWTLAVVLQCGVLGPDPEGADHAPNAPVH